MFFPRGKIMGVYEIWNTINDKKYIGSSVDCRRRRRQHASLLRHNKHQNPILQEDFNGTGEFAFVFLLLEIVEDRAKLVETEQKWMDKINPEYNINPLAGNTVGKYVNNKEAHKKISKSIKAIWASGYMDQFHKGKKRKWKAGHPPNLGKKFSEETRAKISAATTGKNNPNYGKPRTDEHKRLLSIKNAKTYSGAISPDGTVYAPIINMSKFCREHDLGLSSMVAIMKGRRKSHKGWTKYSNSTLM